MVLEKRVVAIVVHSGVRVLGTINCVLKMEMIVLDFFLVYVTVL